MKDCNRCGQAAEVISNTGATLVHFVCDTCRNDAQRWDFNTKPGRDGFTIKGMEYQSPTPDAE